MDHSHRSGSNDSAVAPSVSANSMPNVLFREIHKNAFLKRHSSDRRTGFPRKSERVWVVFCVHDDVEPFLEIYPDQKVALTHKPEWFASLSSALHVSPTICGHEDEFEFAVTLSFQVVRLAAPSWESMMEWVETIRNKLQELKVLCPKENIYSKMPEQKQPLLPTRDPNSPLPLPPEGPSTLLPGVELVHFQSRNSSSSSDNGDLNRHQRDVRNNAMLDKHINKRKINERDKRSGPEQSQPSDMPSSSFTNSENNEINGEEVSQVAVSSGVVLPKKNKQKVKHDASVHQAVPSTSQVSSDRNITVIEVSATGNRENNSMSDVNTRTTENVSDSSDGRAEDASHQNNVSHKMEIRHSGTNINGGGVEEEEEAHYEHVFLPNIPIYKPQLPQSRELISKSRDVTAIKISKSHSTSVLINANISQPISSSQNDAGPGTSSAIREPEVLVSGPTCVNLTRNSTGEQSSNVALPVHQQIQTKLEKVNISGSGSCVPGPAKPGLILKSISANEKDTNLNVVEIKKPTFDNFEQRDVCVTGPEVIRVGMDDNGAPSSSCPTYSQVKKIPKCKVKSDDLRNQGRIPSKSGSPGVSRIKVDDVEPVEGESSCRYDNPIERSRNHLGNAKPSSRMMPIKKSGENKNSCPTNINVRNEPSRSSDRSQCSSSITKTNENKTDVVTTPTAFGVDNSKSSQTKKESYNNSNNNPEVEPIPATVQPQVGVISVEDIPLIGGHQRRRRRSSSSDATQTPNPAPSRGIGGADRIRINIPQTSNHLTRDDHRCENEMRAAAAAAVDQIVHINPTPKASRLTLREQQVLQLKKEMLHPGGVRLQLRRKDCTGSIALVDALNGVWVAGWKQKEHPLLYNALHIGDQLISVSDMMVRTSADAHKLIRGSTSPYVEFIIRRVPFGNVFALQRSSEGQNLGIVQEGNTAEIKEILPNSVAARQGLTSKTPTCDGLSLTTWFLTEINGRPLNLFFKDTEVKDRLNAVGKEISILVQPHDFIKQIKKQLKNMRGYKDYIVQ